MPIATVFGRLALPPQSRREYEMIRLQLVDRLLTTVSAPGEAWLAAWREAASALAERLLVGVEADVRRAAVRSRMPLSDVRARTPRADAREILTERLSAEALTLEELVADPITPANTRARGVAVEAAWEGAEQTLRQERARWQREIDAVAAWRRPWRPLAITTTVVMLCAVVLAAWLGGWLPAPEWFRPVTTAFWTLPWP